MPNDPLPSNKQDPLPSDEQVTFAILRDAEAAQAAANVQLEAAYAKHCETTEELKKALAAVPAQG